VVACLRGTGQALENVIAGRVSAAAGQAAYDFLCKAIDLASSGATEGIVTAPLHKAGLRAAGLSYPGHTEILAERTGTKRYAMLLHGKGISVIHVTLHMALRRVFELLSVESIVEKIRLLDGFVRRLNTDRGARPESSKGVDGNRPRLAVAGLNPHASDGGLFGDEEAEIIEPAVRQAREEGIDASGPLPSDTLFGRAQRGEFDGLVVMYHDQGHIGMKLLAGMQAVNVTVGLPFVRTSVAHGTAYDIAGRGVADAASLVEAARVAARLARTKTE
jgi:4-hydroxythreonine-4-phosphate dehydrogenase